MSWNGKTYGVLLLPYGNLLLLQREAAPGRRREDADHAGGMARRDGQKRPTATRASSGW